MGILAILIIVLIIIGIIGIRRHQPQLVIVAWLSLAVIVAGMIWFLLMPDPSGAVIIG